MISTLIYEFILHQRKKLTQELKDKEWEGEVELEKKEEREEKELKKDLDELKLAWWQWTLFSLFISLFLSFVSCFYFSYLDDN